ncbi:MAG: hypothetical protein Q8P13_04690 [bacterium]|nr:hypothetical protein [bacterium]
MEQEKPTTKEKIIAFSAWVLFFLPFALAKKSDYAVFYGNQSFLLIGSGALALITVRLFPDPFRSIFATMIYFSFFILWVYGMYSSLRGRKKRVPIVGKINFEVSKFF